MSRLLDDQYKTEMLNAVRSMGLRNQLTITECGRLAGSICRPIPEQIKPFDSFTAYLFEKHFGDL